MAKSATQRLNEFWGETDATRATVKSFTDAAYKNYGSHSYASGWLESTVCQLIMELPKKRREEMRQQFAEQAKKHEHQALLNTMKDSEKIG
jgi:hypothetical protein